MSKYSQKELRLVVVQETGVDEEQYENYHFEFQDCNGVELARGNTLEELFYFSNEAENFKDDFR